MVIAAERGGTVPTWVTHMSVTVVVKMDFSILQICLNSALVCLFCVDLNRAPKIIKNFV